MIAWEQHNMKHNDSHDAGTSAAQHRHTTEEGNNKGRRMYKKINKRGALL